MIKYLPIFTFLFLLSPVSYGQSASELYNGKNYPELVKLENKSDELSADELYMVGFAFFQLENDEKAVKFYDEAISKGLNNGSVHFYKGMSLRYLKQYDEALKEIELSLKLEPTNQEFMNEKGMVYYEQKEYDKALEIFEQAKKLPSTYPEPYYWTARIYHERKDFSKALAGFYEAVTKLPKENSCYVMSLMSIGQLEYIFTKDYLKSAKAYSEAIELRPQNYELFYKLMKSYNAAKQYAKADSIFGIVKIAFEKGKLPKDDMEVKSIAVAQSEWKGQNMIISRSLVDAVKTLDISYKVFLLNKEGDKVERRFLVEKTFELEGDNTKYLLCEEDKKNRTHYTYPYGWPVDNIPLDDLEKAVKIVLDGKMQPQAASQF